VSPPVEVPIHSEKPLRHSPGGGGLLNWPRMGEVNRLVLGWYTVGYDVQKRVPEERKYVFAIDKEKGLSRDPIDGPRMDARRKNK